MKNRMTMSDVNSLKANGTAPPAAPRHGEGDLTSLIVIGKELGYLTFDQVNAYLPDEAVDPEKIDALLVALEERLSLIHISEPTRPY